MSDRPRTVDDDQPLTVQGLGCRPRHRAGRRVLATRSLMTYYRLRGAVLAARVAALEAELEQRERQLQRTIDRYEQLLDQPDEDWVVTPVRGPDVDHPTTED